MLPAQLVLSPYSPAQIFKILLTRFATASNDHLSGEESEQDLRAIVSQLNIVDCEALELISRSVGAKNGDLRRAMQIVRDVLSRKMEGVNNIQPKDSCIQPGVIVFSGGSDDTCSAEATITAPPEAAISIADVRTVLSACFDSNIIEIIKDLPSQAQLIVCTAVKLYFANPHSAVTLHQVCAISRYVSHVD